MAGGQWLKKYKPPWDIYTKTQKTTEGEIQKQGKEMAIVSFTDGSFRIFSFQSLRSSNSVHNTVLVICSANKSHLGKLQNNKGGHKSSKQYPGSATRKLLVRFFKANCKNQ